MKKYKLIKEYPGSPSIGEIVEYIPQQDLYAFHDYKAGHNIFYLRDVNQFPEFWQKVVEKEYEILSYKGVYSDNIITKLGNNNINFDTDAWIIHSIKRLSDGEVFTVGDKIDGPCGRNQEITRINTDWIYYLNAKHVIYTYRLSDIKKAKQPLFKTEDGVDVFEDIYKYIHSVKISSHVITSIECTKENLEVVTNKWKNDYKFFSTKEAAEEYIINYKPCLSLFDIKGYLNDYQIEVVKRMIKCFK